MALASRTSVEELAIRKQKQAILRKQCEATQQNILEIKENILKSRAKNSSSLRDALQSSTMRANSLLAHEVQLKSLLKEVTAVPHSASCSTLYAIPEDVAEKIKNAKSASDSKLARKEAKDAYYFAAAERMRLYVLNKQEAVMKATMKGASINVLPSPGPILFENQMNKFYENQVFRPKFVDRSNNNNIGPSPRQLTDKAYNSKDLGKGLLLNESLYRVSSRVMPHQNSSTIVHGGSQSAYSNLDSKSPYESMVMNDSSQLDDSRFNLKTSSQYENGNFDIYNRDNPSRGFGGINDRVHDSSYMSGLNTKRNVGRDAMDDDDISSVCSEVELTEERSVQFH